MPCSMKDSSDPLVMFVYCTCCHHWLCSIVVGRSLLESTFAPHQSALYGYHATKAVVLEWCSLLMYSGSHFWLGGWVVCCHWGWQYHWCGQWWLWWKKCYVQTQRWDCLHMMISPGITTCPMQFHMIEVLSLPHMFWSALISKATFLISADQC